MKRIAKTTTFSIRVDQGILNLMEDISWRTRMTRNDLIASLLRTVKIDESTRHVTCEFVYPGPPEPQAEKEVVPTKREMDIADIENCLRGHPSQTVREIVAKTRIPIHTVYHVLKHYPQFEAVLSERRYRKSRVTLWRLVK